MKEDYDLWVFGTRKFLKCFCSNQKIVTHSEHFSALAPPHPQTFDYSRLWKQFIKSL